MANKLLADNGAISGISGLSYVSDSSGALQIYTGAGVLACTIDANQNVILPNNINVPNTFGFKNRIINGAFQVDQYNKFASHTIQNSNATYLVDRFFGTAFGAAVTGQIITAVAAKRYRITGAAGCTSLLLGTRLEKANTYDLYGNNAVFSIKASSSSLTSLTWTAYYANSDDAFGTLNSPAQTQIAAGTFTISSTENTYSASFPVATGTGIAIVISAGALGASATLTLGDWQLEKGSTPTSFDYREYGEELRKCQRYYYKQQSTTNYTNFGMGRSYSTTGAQAAMSLPVSMRAAPTGSYSALSDFNSAAGTITAMSPAGNIGSDFRWVMIDITQTGGATAQTIALNANNNNNAWMAWSAEL